MTIAVVVVVCIVDLGVFTGKKTWSKKSVLLTDGKERASGDFGLAGSQSESERGGDRPTKEIMQSSALVKKRRKKIT
jgi:hypothetical protein